MKKFILVPFLLIFGYWAQAQCNLLPNAIPGISLVHQNTNCFNNSGVAFNPNLNLYYAVRAGNSVFPLETWTATGAPLFNTSAGFDWRGMWWNPTTNQLEGNGYNTSGIWRADLNGSGYALNSGANIFFGMNQPDAQSCGDLDWQAYEILYYNNGLIHRYSRTTNVFLGSYPITGTPVPISNLNSTTLMYTGCPGKEIALLDYINKRVYVYNKATGAFAGTSQLPATAVTTGSFRTSWANCHVWLFNLTNFTWNSYKIVDACSSCPPVYTNQTPSICNGDSLFVGGAWQVNSGTYYDTLLAASGCDSIIVNTLTVMPTPIVNQSYAICTGDSLLLGGAWQSTNGIYVDTLTSSAGCDSIISSTLTILPILFGSQQLAICNNDSIFIGGAWQQTSGVYYDTLTGSSGCDSILSSTLTILPDMFATRTVFICSGDSIFLGGSWQNNQGVFIDTLTTVAGCDSILSTTLMINPVYNQTTTKEICEGESIFLGGQWRTIPGIYVDAYNAISGCDSFMSTILIVHPLPTVDLGSDKTLCDGELLVIDATTPNVTYLWQDNSSNSTLTVTQTGTYWVVVTENNCVDKDTIQVIYNEVPQVDLGPDQQVCPDRTVVLNVTTPNAVYRWHDNSKKPEYTVTKDGIYWVTVSLLNCSASDTVRIDFTKPDCGCPVFIPNAFSPNNDLNNDELKLLNTFGVDLKDFRIYNRWGEEVFKTQGLFDHWNGNFKGEPAEIGTYYYFVKYVCKYNGKEYLLKGDITLIR